MIRGILFDMDGTLIDTEAMSHTTTMAVLARHGLVADEAFFQSLCGLARLEWEARYVEHFGAELATPALFEELQNEFVALLNQQGPPPKPNLVATLTALQERGYAMALASATQYEQVVANLERLDVLHFFDFVVGGDQVKHSKPAPDIFLAAAEGLGLSPAECLVVEDSYNGLKAGFTAGCPTVMIPDMMPPTDEIRRKAAAVLPALGDLPAFLAECEKRGRALAHAN